MKHDQFLRSTGDECNEARWNLRGANDASKVRTSWRLYVSEVLSRTFVSTASPENLTPRPRREHTRQDTDSRSERPTRLWDVPRYEQRTVTWGAGGECTRIVGSYARPLQTGSPTRVFFVFQFRSRSNWSLLYIGAAEETVCLLHASSGGRTGDGRRRDDDGAENQGIPRPDTILLSPLKSCPVVIAGVHPRSVIFSLSFAALLPNHRPVRRKFRLYPSFPRVGI